jgi:hypothetical protein
MMRYRQLLLLAALVPAACGPLPPPADTARLPPGVFGVLDQDVPAIQYAEYAFSVPAHTYGNPAAGAEAVMAMDYIAGQLNTSPRWAFMPATTQLQLLQGRQQTRAAVGIAPHASSQLVVNSLYAARNYLQIGQVQAAEAMLSNPAFTLPPAETIHRLAYLPYIQMANVSTVNAGQNLFQSGAGDHFGH